MAGYSLVNGVALKESASPIVFENLVQNILHVNGKGCDETYTNAEVLGSKQLAIPRTKLGGGAFRKLGATVNGGQFNGLAAIDAESDIYYLDLTFVYDRIEQLAKIMNDKAGYKLMESKMKNLALKIARGVNALTFATQFGQVMNESYDATAAGGSALYVAKTTGAKEVDLFLDANAALDEGDENIGCDFFPRDMRQAFVRPTFLSALKKSNGNVILNSNLGQEMLATGLLNPFKNEEASKIEMRSGYSGELDGVPVYSVSPILWKLAATYCVSNGAALDETAFDGILAAVTCGLGTLRGFTSTENIEVGPSPLGQGWIFQPLVHGGVACLSGKSVRLITDTNFANPVTSAETKITILPPESQPAA